MARGSISNIVEAGNDWGQQEIMSRPYCAKCKYEPIIFDILMTPLELVGWMERCDIKDVFEKYVPKFIQQDISAKSFLELNENDLRELGITIGHKKAILLKIAELKEKESSDYVSKEQRDQQQLEEAVQKAIASVKIEDIVGKSIESALEKKWKKKEGVFVHIRSDKHKTYLRIYDKGDQVYFEKEEKSKLKHQFFIQREGDKVTIQTPFGSYLSAVNGGAGTPVHLTSTVGKQEIFIMKKTDDAKWVFETTYDTYLRANRDGRVDVQIFVGSWEKFEIELA